MPREAIAALFDAANRYLGNLIGELLGELALAAWLACIGVALRRSDRRWVGTLTFGAASVIAIGALRQLTPAVLPIAAAANVVLPLWLFVSAREIWRRPIS